MEEQFMVGAEGFFACLVRDFEEEKMSLLSSHININEHRSADISNEKNPVIYSIFNAYQVFREKQTADERR